MKPLTVNLEYPSFDYIQEDKKSALTLFDLYAGRHGELNAILQYVYHYFYFNRLGKGDIAKTLMSIAIAEMHHLEILGELILRLGLDPIFASFPPFKADYYSASSVRYSKSASKMLLDDISSEMVAVCRYEEIISLMPDEKVQAILSRIKLDEQLHVKALKECLEQINR